MSDDDRPTFRKIALEDRSNQAGRVQGAAPKSLLLPVIRVTAAERASIKAGAERVHMTISAYLRALGTGYSPASKVDVRAIHELTRCRADLGRLGGLLKLCLKDQIGGETAAQTLDQLLAEIERSVAELKEKIRQL